MLTSTVPNIFLYGGSFLPPGKHHRKLIEAVRQIMYSADWIKVIPCGIRSDRDDVRDIMPWHRATMCRLAFGNMRKVELDLSDLENETFTRTFDLDAQMRRQYPECRIWHIVGTDWITRGADGLSKIQREWHRGVELWNKANFLIIPRKDYLITARDLPPHSHMINMIIPGSGTDIRHAIQNHQSIDTLVDPPVADYIRRHHLFTGRMTDGWTEFAFRGSPIIHADDRPRSGALKDMVLGACRERLLRGDPQDHHVVIGGDGYMLRTIRENMHSPFPFIGLNAGTLGFLLNDGTTQELRERLERGVVRAYHQPLLQAEATDTQGRVTRHYAFNDFFLRSGSDQCVWMRVTVNGQERFSSIAGDGLMLSTAAGSTGWSRQYGAQPYRIGFPLLVLTGVGMVANWRQGWAPLSLNSVVTVECLDERKRPLNLVVDGVNQGPIRQVTLRLSRTRSVELGFFKETDLDKKVSDLHFP